jgi:hypothetical protein
VCALRSKPKGKSQESELLLSSEDSG